MTARRLSDAQKLVDWIRAMLDMPALYAANGKSKGTGDIRGNSYAQYERLRKRADPECTKCDGAGYTMGAAHDPEFECKCLRAEAVTS